jgi:hypothetical protein
MEICRKKESGKRSLIDLHEEACTTPVHVRIAMFALKIFSHAYKILILVKGRSHPFYFFVHKFPLSPPEKECPEYALSDIAYSWHSLLQTRPAHVQDRVWIDG